MRRRKWLPARSTIRVVEGNDGRFILDKSLVRDDIVQGLLDDIKDCDIVSLDTLERAMLIINDTPGVTVTRADNEHALFGIDGLTQASAAVTLGDLRFDDATAQALDAADPKTQGVYARLNLQVTRATALPRAVRTDRQRACATGTERADSQRHRRADPAATRATRQQRRTDPRAGLPIARAAAGWVGVLIRAARQVCCCRHPLEDPPRASHFGLVELQRERLHVRSARVFSG
jgi:hypothetical protein